MRTTPPIVTMVTVKENIVPVKFSALELLSKIDIVQFNYRADAVANGYGDDSSIKHYGFIR